MNNALANVGSSRVRCFGNPNGYEQSLDPDQKESVLAAFDVVQPDPHGRLGRYAQRAHFLLMNKGLPQGMAGVEAQDLVEIGRRVDSLFAAIWPLPTWKSGDLKKGQMLWSHLLEALFGDALSVWPARAKSHTQWRVDRAPKEKEQAIRDSAPSDEAVTRFHDAIVKSLTTPESVKLVGEIRKELIEQYHQVTLDTGSAGSEFVGDWA